MKKLILALVLFLFPKIYFSQLNMSQLAFVDYNALHNTGCSNLWGYVDELGNEYAIVGANNGTSVVDVTDPQNPVEVYFMPDSNSIWREVKVYNNYAYITTEEHVGLTIIDLNPLPQSVALPNYRFHGATPHTFNSAHSLFIDENGILYLNGSDILNGGVIFYDLTADPINPPEVGYYGMYYVHDCFARGDTLYTAHIYDGFFSVIDVSDKANPVVLATQNTPSNFTHNCWISDNGKNIFTTDEVGGAYIASYDISNLNNIELLDKAQSNPGSMSIPHNVYYKDGFLVTSYYRDGVVVHDASDPANLIQVGNIDVSPLSGNGFNSIWGVYPYLPSGNLIASDIEKGLYIFGVTYVHGSFLHGTVVNASNLNPVYNAQVSIINQQVNDNTDLAGEYHSGIGTPGTYDIAFYKPGFERDTVYGVTLTTGDTVYVDVQLTPLVPVTVSGQITEQGTGNPVATAVINFRNDEYDFWTTTDASGNYMINNAYTGVYDVYIGHWGHWNYCDEGIVFSTSVNNYNQQLKKGYYDDFTFDFGWSVIAGATAGNWVLDVPIATGLSDGTPSNPHFDVSNDCGDKCFMTGNELGAVGNADVDGGPTVLISPVFDATIYTEPWVGYQHWFFNYVATVPPNDTLQIFIANGIDTVLVESVRANNFAMSQWVDTSWRISDYVLPTTNMRLILSVADYDATGGNLCEAAIDRFYVSEGNQLAVNEVEEDRKITVYPNPSTGMFTIGLSGNESVFAAVYEITGRKIYSNYYANQQFNIDLNAYPSGIYFLQLQSKSGDIQLVKLIKQ